MQWLSKKNGELFGIMMLENFKVFVTMDKNLSRQQNSNEFFTTIFVRLDKNNKLETLKKITSPIHKKIEKVHEKNEKGAGVGVIEIQNNQTTL